MMSAHSNASARDAVLERDRVAHMRRLPTGRCLLLEGDL
jgi:hypothetical protein